MKRIKQIGKMLLYGILAWSICIHVQAQEPMEIGMDAYVAEDGVLKLYINHNQGESFTVMPEKVKVMFGNNEMVTQSILKLEDADVPISYKCVVDVSGSMSQERIDQAKAIIKELANKKKAEDSIAITAMGNELIQSAYMTNPAEIFEKADILTLTREDTNLYYAIVQEIKGLQTADEVSRKRCLIIFSDGADDQATGITREEAEKAVTDSHIPVFTIGLLKDESDQAKEMAKVLGSFARISSGGEHFTPLLAEESVETIAGTIVDKLNHSLILEENLEQIDVSGKEVVLKISISTETGETDEDSVTVSESDIKIIHEEQLKAETMEEPAIEEPTIEEPVTQESIQIQETPSFSRQYGGWFVLTAILLFFLLVLLKKKKKNGMDRQEEREEGGYQKNNLEREAESITAPAENNPTIGDFSGEGMTILPVNLERKDKGWVKKKYRVTLVGLGKHSDRKYDILLEDSCTIGRNEEKCSLVLAKDTALSGVHATLLVEADRVYIRDEKSTNGTFVNGIPISGKFELSQDDIILLGSYEYRISWK